VSSVSVVTDAPAREPERAHGGPFGARVALSAFVVAEVIAFPLAIYWDRGTWFQLDDWDFLAARTAGSMNDLFRPHFEHWSTLPILAWRLLWTVFGLHTITPYEVLAIVVHLAVAALLRVIMRRSGVNPWVATAVATLFVFFGRGAEDVLVAFQVTLVASLLFALLQLLLADHDGPLGRRDALGLLAGFIGLLCSGLAVTMTITVGIALLLRRGWRAALLHTVPLGLTYFVWRAVAPKESAPDYYHAQSLGQVVRFIAVGVRATLGGIGQLPGFGLVFGALLIVGVVLAFRDDARGVLRGRAALPVALLLGSLTFLVITAVVRAGTQNAAPGETGLGPEHARLSRYVYLVAALSLPMVAFAADAIVRRWRQAVIPMVVLLLVGLPGNIQKFSEYARPSPFAKSRRAYVLEAPRLPIARQLPRSLELGVDLTMGWLIDSVPSGRIPKPPPRTPLDIANESISLALQVTSKPPSGSCVPLMAPTVRTLARGQRVSVRSGKATATYVPVGGAPSTPRPFASSAFVSEIDGLRVRIAPAGGAPELCG
jgi:hypothetical protein